MSEKQKFILSWSLIFVSVVLAFVFQSKFGKELIQNKEISIEKQAGINLVKNLEEIEELIQGNDLNKIKVKIEEIKHDYQQVVGGLSKTSGFLKDKKIEPKILASLSEFEKQYGESVGGLVEELSQAKNISDFQKNLPVIREVNSSNETVFSEEISNDKPFKVTAEGKVIKRMASKLEILSSPKINNIQLVPTQSVVQDSSPTQEYLVESEEIEFSQSIKNLADSLGKDPLKILNYVKNNIDFVPYYGIKKGSDATLIEKAGNDFDQSALLIALLRYSGYPAKYERGQIKLSLSHVMNLLGVDDPLVAAKLLSKTHIPYILYTDQNDEPLFFSIEHIWVEAYITYDYTRGTNQNENESDKTWVPMEPSLKTVHYSQLVDIIDEMGFNVTDFSENYLQGNYDQQKPIEAYQQEIENYLTTNHSDLTYDDILTKGYKNSEKLEFIPNTLPYEVVENFNEYSQAPDNLKHKIQFEITNKESGLELLNYTEKVYNIADKQIVLTYVAASSGDQQLIDQYDSIYDIVPLSLVHMKPVVKVNGEVITGAVADAPEITLGKKEKLVMRFLVPTKDGGPLTEIEADKIEKEMIVGNDEGVAINTDRIVLPELRPGQDTQTDEFLSAQKLYRTALNFLDRLQQSHKELAESLGGEFTNAATRAIVFNGIDVNYQGGEPYSFTWKGLRIDSSSTVNYFSHFGDDIKRNQTRFMYLFGLEASLNESSIFEEDFDIEAMSTVKGLRMINQGQMPGTSMVKITSANRSVINGLSISEPTKTKFRTSVDAGNIIYTASQQYTYGNFTGLVYIELNPQIGDGGYIIGEGFNGGYTVGEWSEWWKMLWQGCVLNNITASFISPTPNQEFIKGDKIRWTITYSGLLHTQPTQSLSWFEFGDIYSDQFATGSQTIRAGYGASQSVQVVVKKKITLGGEYDHTGMDDIIIDKANEYGIPPALLKSLIYKETQSDPFNPKTYRYEPGVDYSSFSGSSSDAYDRIISYPFKQFALPGKNSNGQNIIKGDQVDTLVPLYTTIVRSFATSEAPTGWSLRSIVLKDRNDDKRLTIGELYENDKEIGHGSQAWPKLYDYTFTPQLLLASSYGLGHVLYREAVLTAKDPNGYLWFDISTTGLAKNIYDMTDLETSVELAASMLKTKFNMVGGAVPNDNCNGWSEAIRVYNGNGPEAIRYREIVCRIYYADHLFDIQ